MQERQELKPAQRRALFCVLMAQGRSPGRAAQKAGLVAPGEDPEVAAALLLSSAGIRRRLARMTGELSIGSAAGRARAGLERLAFEEADCAQPEAEGSFHIASVRRDKNGETCYTFYDRLKALALLAGLKEPEPAAGELSLLEALGRAAQACAQEEEGLDG